MDRAGVTVVHRARGLCGDLLVLDIDGYRHLRFGGLDGVDQTVVQLRRPGLLPTAYLRVAALGVALARRAERFLLVGLGGGAYARFLAHCFPAARIDVVEVDPIVVHLAHEYFGFREGRRLRVHVGDAADFVARSAEDEATWDSIFLDAYHGQAIPQALCRASFFRKVCDRLTEGGTVAANVGLPEHWAEDRLVRRFASAFAEGCLEFAVPDEDNRVVVAWQGRRPAERTVAARCRRADREGVLPFELLPLAGEPKIWPPPA